MAYAISKQSGYANDAATWGREETGPNAVFNTGSMTLQSPSTTGYNWSSTFTIISGHTVDGVILSGKRLSSTGTLTVALSDNGGSSVIASVTVNVTDLPENTNWIFFYWGSVVGTGGSNYTVGLRASDSNNCAFERQSTVSNNWRRIPRWSTSYTLVAADQIFCVGNLIGPGAYSPITVTWDLTTSTTYSDIVVAPRAMLVSADSPGTNYILQTNGTVTICQYGSLYIGTPSVKIPETSTSSLIFASPDTYFHIYGTFYCNGATKVIRTILAADISAGATTSTTDVPTGWKQNDWIVFMNSGSGNSLEQLTSDASDTTLSHTATDYAHRGLSGSTVWASTIMNLTRNVIITGNATRIVVYETAAVTINCTEITGIGNSTDPKYGFNISLTPDGNNFLISYSTIWNSNYSGQICLYFNNSIAGCDVNCTYNNFYNVDTAIQFSDGIGGNHLFNNNALCVNENGFNINEPCNFNISNTMFGSANSAIHFRTTGIVTSDVTLYSNNIKIVGANNGIVFYSYSNIWQDLVINNFTAACNNATIYVSPQAKAKILINNAYIEVASVFIKLYGSILAYIKDAVVNNESIYSGPASILIVTDNVPTSPYGENSGVIYLDNVSINGYPAFGGDYCGPSDPSKRCTVQRIRFDNSLFLDGHSIARAKESWFGTYAGSHRHNQTNQNYASYSEYGTRLADTSIFRTALPSERVIHSTDTATNMNAVSADKRVAVQPNQTIYISAWVYIGASYDGDNPRLICRRNPAVGVTSDIVLATHSGTKTTWEQLSAALPSVTRPTFLRCYVDCSGTSDSIYVDDWNVTLS